jgi:hypothetical protein
LKKADDISIQAHASVIRELADRLTGLGDEPSEALMVSVLMLSLPESYSTIIISLDTHHDRTNFDFVVQHCMNEEARQAAHSSTHPKAFHADATRTKRNKADITCYNCGEKGHYRNECPKLKKEEKKESKDEEKKDGGKLSAAAAEEEIAW